LSVEAISKVLNYSKAKGSQKLVLIGIANHHGDEGAWPSIKTLARYSNLSERRVQQMIRELAEMGELKIEECQGGGFRQYKTNRYWILTETPGVKPASPRGEAGFVSGVKPASPETLKETKDNHLGEFEKFWEKYPRSENKNQAIKAFEKARKKVSLEVLLKKLEQYKAHNQKNDIKYAYASTWLNQERWADEYDEIVIREDKSKQWTRQLLNEMDEQAKLAGVIPRCAHGNNPALCKECYGKK